MDGNAINILSGPSIVGLEDQPDNAAKVRTLISAMAPAALPKNGIFFLPEKDFQKQAAQIASGQLNGRAIKAGDPAEENFGGNGQRTFVDNAYSVPAWGQMFVNARLLKNPNKLRDILAHELGHFAAQAGDGRESTADRYKSTYIKRANQALKTWDQIQALPVTTRSMPDILSGK